MNGAKDCWEADLVVRGGTVVEADWSGLADVFVKDGKVLAVVAPGTPSDPSARQIDASGRYVVPGGVDPHCHVGFTSGEFTSLDSYQQCTAAAVLGGTTTIVDFAIPLPGHSPLEAVEIQLSKAAEGLCDSALHACVVEWDDTVPDQLAEMARLGIVTVKMYTTYRGETMASADTILRTMQALSPLGGMAVIHCEANHLVEYAQNRCANRGAVAARHMQQTRPELAETAAVAEVLAIAESVGAPVYFVHQSTADAVGLVAEARRRGVTAYSEAVAHHLVLDGSKYDGPHPERFVCCPPLRSRDEVDKLAEQLFSGAIDTVGSDHCCYDTHQKEQYQDDVRAMPNGLPGVETRLPVVFSEFVVKRGLPLERFVALTSTNAAKSNGLFPRKGTLRPGSDADIVIWDSSASWQITAKNLQMATDYTPYEGMQGSGSPHVVIVGGRVIAQDGAIVDPTPRGHHVVAGPVYLNRSRDVVVQSD